MADNKPRQKMRTSKRSKGSARGAARRPIADPLQRYLITGVVPRSVRKAGQAEVLFAASSAEAKQRAKQQQKSREQAFANKALRSLGQAPG